MAEVLVPYALTTQQRVKDRLQITVTTFDTLLLRLISAATDIIESSCNRRFKKTTYTNEVYSARGANPQFIFLKQIPVAVITTFQYRTGTPSNPAWVSFIVDNYELLEGGESGMIRVYGGLPYGVNQVRITYDAGYLIDFLNAGTATHTLPFDLSDLCERLVIKLYKRKESEGKLNESFEGGNVAWKGLLDDEDKMTIAKYRRDPPFA